MGMTKACRHKMAPPSDFPALGPGLAERLKHDRACGKAFSQGVGKPQCQVPGNHNSCKSGHAHILTVRRRWTRKMSMDVPRLPNGQWPRIAT